MRYLLLMLLFLHGCASGNRPLRPIILNLTADSSPVYYTLTIKDLSKVRFNGLLAVSAGENGLHYILLDATGITLLEARIDAQGNAHPKRVLGLLQKSRLPDYLAGALKRIFLEEPATLPCEKLLLTTFCEKNFEAGNGQKWLQSGPFTWWSADFSDISIDNDRQSLVYSQFLSGITLHLIKDSKKTTFP